MTKIITAVDIWQEVLEENGYEFQDEKSKVVTKYITQGPRAGKENNILEFYKEKKMFHKGRPSWSRYASKRIKCSVYFNYKTGDVSDVFFSNDDKDYFASQFESKLRDYKLKSILD